MRPQCLIVDEMHPSLQPLLEDAGFTPVYRPEISRKQILEELPLATGLIIRNKTLVDSELLRKGSRLKFVARAGAGMDLIDTEAAKSLGIELINAPEGNRVALAEHALGMLLALMNHITVANDQIHQGIWDREGNRGTNIENKVIGILGYGNMGSAFARLLSSFNCEVLAFDKYRKGPFEYAQEVTLNTLTDRCHILSIHVPLTTETTQMVNAKFFHQCKNDIYLLNTARGGIVDEADLLTALGSGKVLGAALDVIENEKLDQLNAQQRQNLEALAMLDQVILTPHVGGWSHESYQKINQVLVEKIKSLGI